MCNTAAPISKQHVATPHPFQSAMHLIRMGYAAGCQLEKHRSVLRDLNTDTTSGKMPYSANLSWDTVAIASQTQWTESHRFFGAPPEQSSPLSQSDLGSRKNAKTP